MMKATRRKLQKKSTRQKLLEKLYGEHGIILDPNKMCSPRRNGFGSPIVSWFTLGQNQDYRSFETMTACLKCPTKLIYPDPGEGSVITIEVDLDKIAAMNESVVI